MTRYQSHTISDILHEVSIPQPNAWRLCFQWVRFTHVEGSRAPDGSQSQEGYRFAWRRPDGKRRPGVGLPHAPSAAALFELLRLASEAGWFVSIDAARQNENKDIAGGAKNV